MIACLKTLTTMDCIKNTVGGAPGHARLANGLVNQKANWLLPGGHGLQRRINGRLKALAIWVATCALLLSACVPVQADVNFSNYDLPFIPADREPYQGQGCTALRTRQVYTGPLFYCSFCLPKQKERPGIFALVHRGDTPAAPRQAGRP